MGYRPILYTGFRTVGLMIAHGIEIKALCGTCRTAFKVDLRAIAAVKGEDYSLIGRHPPCRIYDCAGECMFLVAAAEGTPMVTLDRWARE